MAGLGQTVSEVMMRRMREAALRTNAVAANPVLSEVAPTGTNPGHLRMWQFVPPGLAQGAALVVVLHGCTQNAAGFDAGSGWSELAARHGFAVLYPEQQTSNNANTCFNWFNADDIARDGGEAASIAQMVQQMVATHRLDPARVYVTGLSAGGAMTAVMLATYPELFAGGAVIAGLPFGAATSMPAAFEAMRQVRSRPPREWGDLVRAASPFRERRPSVQLWHGTADSTVRPGAMEASAAQWCDVAGIDATPRTDTVDGATHQCWMGPDGRAAVETFLIPGLGHGVPLHTEATDLDESVGAPAPFMLESDIGSTRRIAQSWGLLTQAPRTRGRRRTPQPAPGTPVSDLGDLIQGALRRAGLPV